MLRFSIVIILDIHLAKLQSKQFSVLVFFNLPFREQEANAASCPYKAQKKKRTDKEIEEATARQAAAEEMSVNATLSELDGMLELREKQRTALKVFLGEKGVFALL